jgi:hypothetical protein
MGVAVNGDKHVTQNISAIKLTALPAKDVGSWKHPMRLNQGCRILDTAR